MATKEMTFGLISDDKKTPKTKNVPPTHIMVGRVRVKIDDVSGTDIVYHEWLNMVGSDRWGNVNMQVDTAKLEYVAWLDYGYGILQNTKFFRGKLKDLSQSEVNRIGSEIYKAYPYKETMKAVVDAQKNKRR